MHVTAKQHKKFSSNGHLPKGAFDRRLLLTPRAFFIQLMRSNCQIGTQRSHDTAMVCDIAIFFFFTQGLHRCLKTEVRQINERPPVQPPF